MVYLSHSIYEHNKDSHDNGYGTKNPECPLSDNFITLDGQQTLTLENCGTIRFVMMMVVMMMFLFCHFCFFKGYIINVYYLPFIV
jgi:hypothetical protein